MENLRVTFASDDILPFYVSGASATASVDGVTLATAVLEDVVITDLRANQTVHTLEGDGEPVTVVQLTPDGHYLGVVSQSQQLRVFDCWTRTLTRTFKLSSPVYVAAADPTSTLFAFGGADGAVTVWDIENGYITHSLKGHGTTVCSLAFHGELNNAQWKLASGDIMGQVRIWDLVKRKCLHTINEHNSAVRGLAFSASGETFISGGRDQVLVMYDATKKYKVAKTIPTRQQVENAGFITVGAHEYMYTGGSGNVLTLWDVATGEVRARSAAPLETNEELMITNILPLEDEGEHSLMLVISDQTLVELDFSAVEDVIEDGDEATIPVKRRVAGNHGTIADIRYVGPEYDLFAMATNSPALRIIDPKTPYEVQLLEGHTDLLNAIDVTVDGRWIATASKDHDARLWRWDDARGAFSCAAVFQGHADPVTALALPRTPVAGFPAFLITGSGDHTIKKWKITKSVMTAETPEIIASSEYTRRAHDKDINAIDIAPNDEFFCSASFDKTAKVWDLESGTTVGILTGHKRGLWDVKFCQYDKLLVTASGDKTLKVWSLTDFSVVKTLEGHTNSVQRVCFFNQNKQILSSGADGLVKIWDCTSGECAKTFDHHANRIWALATRDDGAAFVSADADGAIAMWRDNTDATIAQDQLDRKHKVEQEQSLANFINKGDWSNAFLLALTLDHPMRLYNVLKASIASGGTGVLGSEQMDECVAGLNADQLMVLFKRLRDWNTNSKLFEVSQKVIHLVLARFEANTLSEIPGLVKLVEAIIPYSERHYTRVDDLVEESYVLDYALAEMNRI
ncbi:hypothetical protein BABINDRAFT_171163 [Babjeviella inositovora NRRL Y-12698]|uniref:U3 small nucleolar RNA-associated protein 13 C-terminal domain-containing protein n=1 Tax=Babjeviella inositovora NRRL Y-12698 TaxID=984486 RepID=A0A1E3QT56_9ASCO|nr:uncharacterized protein BABINDRAFT_171163 [Babjeviella inositovora NRRL Y-12698]ODQ80107.1 hypothetical protein BABINDRAFT_171163 [Babjeviella inositovora NRRL Y-12698]